VKLPYQRIEIIYNPNSTSGNAKARAQKLHKTLKAAGAKHLQLTATEYAGHAEKMAYDITCSYEQPLLISVSGDGGYNEVINGAIRAMDERESRRPVCAILAAGNANDHRRTVRRKALAHAILNDKPEAIDILSLSVKHPVNGFKRYAHSYIGFGLTGTIADQLNRERLNRFREVAIVLRTLLRFDHFTLTSADGKHEDLDSIVFAKLHQMSKIYKMGVATNLHDGLFRVVAIPHRHRFWFFVRVVAITLFGFKNPPLKTEYVFTLDKTQFAHCDGEVVKVPGTSEVRILCERGKMLTLR